MKQFIKKLWMNYVEAMSQIDPICYWSEDLFIGRQIRYRELKKELESSNEDIADQFNVFHQGLGMVLNHRLP